MPILFVFIVSAFFIAIPEAVAATKIGFGEHLYCTVRQIITGNIGTLIGLLIAFAGFVGFITSENRNYLIWILAGIAVTAYPGLFESFLSGMASASSAVDEKDKNLVVKSKHCSKISITDEKGSGNVKDPETGKIINSTEVVGPPQL